MNYGTTYYWRQSYPTNDIESTEFEVRHLLDYDNAPSYGSLTIISDSVYTYPERVRALFKYFQSPTLSVQSIMGEEIADIVYYLTKIDRRIYDYQDSILSLARYKSVIDALEPAGYYSLMYVYFDLTEIGVYGVDKDPFIFIKDGKYIINRLRRKNFYNAMITLTLIANMLPNKDHLKDVAYRQTYDVFGWPDAGAAIMHNFELGNSKIGMGKSQEERVKWANAIVEMAQP